MSSSEYVPVKYGIRNTTKTIQSLVLNPPLLRTESEIKGKQFKV